MIYRYVNLNKFYDSWDANTNSGVNINSGLTVNTPMSYSYFFRDLQNYEILNDDLTYYLSGSRNSWDFCSWDNSQCNLDIVKEVLQNSPVRTIYFKSYNGEPWKFEMVGNQPIRIQVGFFGNNSQTHRVIFENGMFESNTGSIVISNISNTCKEDLYLNTVLLKSNSIIYPNFSNVYVKGSTTVANELQTNSSQNFNIVNSILGVTNFVGDNPANTIKYININQVVTSNTLYNYNVGNNFAINGLYQENWSIPSILQQNISAYNISNLSYLTSAFNTITLTGSNTVSNRTIAPWGVNRDGIGFLYFDPLEINAVKPVETSGNIPWNCSVLFNDHLTSAGKIVIDWLDGSNKETFTSGTSATHTYTEIGEYVISVRNYTKNFWYNTYDFCTDDLTVNAVYDQTISANIQILEQPDLNDLGLSLRENTWVIISAGNVIGNPTNYRLLLKQNGNLLRSGGYTDLNGFSNILMDYHFDINSYGFYSVELYLNEGLSNAFYTSASVFVDYSLTNSYWVDLCRKVGGGSGTSADPFTFAEMANMVRYQGEANEYDTFYLKGDITLERPTNETYPYIPISVDYRKGLNFKPWDASLFGPWIISSKDDSVTDNIILDFTGGRLYGGIIYNQPYYYNGQYYGGKIRLNTIVGCYVVCQGVGSSLELTSYVAGGTSYYMAGCTVYAENNIVQTRTSATQYNSILDTVINHFTIDNLTYIDDNITVRNSCFASTSASFSAYTHLSMSDSQFNWTQPSIWPFRVGTDNYGKNIDWVVLYKENLMLFDNISTPPQPGTGFDDYVPYFGYEEDLFGNSRILYYRKN